MSYCIDYFFEKTIDEQFIIKALNDYLPDGVASIDYPQPTSRFFLSHQTYDIGFRCAASLYWKDDAPVPDEAVLAEQLAKALDSKVIFEPNENTLPPPREWHLVDEQGKHYATNIIEFEDGIALLDGSLIPL